MRGADLTGGMPNQRLLRGALAGVAGGIAGTMAMDVISAIWTLLRRRHWHAGEATLVQQGGRPDVDQAKELGRHSGEREAVATTAIAERTAEATLGRPLSPGERHEGGRLVHYLFGAALGGCYGAASEQLPVLGGGRGIPFGIAVWVGGVEIALPLLNLSDAPGKYSAKHHAFAAVTHIAYGFTTEVVRRSLQSLDQR